MATLEASFRVELNDRERQTYIDKLVEVPLMDLTAAIDDCQRSWRPQFGVNFPPLFDLLDFVNTAHGRRLLKTNTREILQRDDKPLEKSDLTKAAVRLNITKQQIADWMEQGKRTQQVHIAELAKDPEWQALHQQFGQPGLKPAPTRTFESEEQKQQWSRETAKANGWAK